jgi:hypothetical protein
MDSKKEPVSVSTTTSGPSTNVSRLPQYLLLSHLMALPSLPRQHAL